MGVMTFDGAHFRLRSTYPTYSSPYQVFADNDRAYEADGNAGGSVLSSACNSSVIPFCTDDATGTCILNATRSISDTQFAANNIASGVNILGVVGTHGGAPGTGYFVLTNSTWNGNLGGFSGANAKCLSELTGNTNWKYYTAANGAGLLNSTAAHRRSSAA
jgi:hypothetical protein